MVNKAKGSDKPKSIRSTSMTRVCRTLPVKHSTTGADVHNRNEITNIYSFPHNLFKNSYTTRLKI